MTRREEGDEEIELVRIPLAEIPDARVAELEDAKTIAGLLPLPALTQRRLTTTWLPMGHPDHHPLRSYTARRRLTRGFVWTPRRDRSR